MSKINLYHGDSLEAMKTMPDKKYDLAICDPPYGIEINMNMGRKKGKRKAHEEKKWDDAIPTLEYFNELFRVSKNQIIWGGNYFPLPLVKGWIFWDKHVPDGVSFADGELAWTSFPYTLKKISVPYTGFVGTEGKIHPTQKPVKLYKKILQEYAKPDYKVLDTHGGSMSIAIACYDFGCSLDLWELDAEYYRRGVDRFEKHKSQLNLFRA